MAEMTGMMEKLMSNFQRQSLWGYNLGPGISPDSVKYAYEKWTPRKTDVFLAAYPKTGETQTTLFFAFSLCYK